jgi:Uma2 family endonuclease
MEAIEFDFPVIKRSIKSMATATLPKLKAKRLWTYEEMLAELPETNLPMELWDGEIIMSPTPTPSHQTIVLKFVRALDDFVSGQKAGTVFVSPLDVVLSQHRVVQPDLFFILEANSKIIQDRIRGVPDLVVEVISQTWKRDRIEKKALYEQFGVSEYWIVDPESRAIEVFALVKGVYQLHSKGTETTAAKSRLPSGFKISFNNLRA